MSLVKRILLFRLPYQRVWYSLFLLIWLVLWVWVVYEEGFADVMREVEEHGLGILVIFAVPVLVLVAHLYWQRTLTWIFVLATFFIPYMLLMITATVMYFTGPHEKVSPLEYRLLSDIMSLVLLGSAGVFWLLRPAGVADKLPEREILTAAQSS